MSVFRNQKWTQGHREKNLWLPKGKGKGEG